ncbi:MAG: F420-0:Gamma-glutamyl ligase [Peptococcaceae bacterium]|nr:MAG: F420-0:Gamma-glutamyl ligase [Peptococcaceae bacterium]
MIIGKIPIKTHIITEKDNIVEVVKVYTGNVAAPGDIVAIAESVVAITQDRAILPETVRPSLLARFLCRFPGKNGSLATPPAMQLAIDDTGTGRIILGAVAAVIGKLLRRRGDFYRVAGRHLTLIDDIAGTMWPYERHIILGPKGSREIVDEIRAETGLEAVIADINDTGNVDILAASAGIDQKQLIRYLEDNPFGNDDQQTPIVLFKVE